jgi:hypothetical protein
MIKLIESNCQTLEVRYFDENNNEISKEDALFQISRQSEQ